ncbi:TATA box binding protein (TBP)-associated factor, RNA polymerase II [Trachipleistophora hominis]|uniref:Transcription initiation factor TFIID subunit 4 n=1 Tax=Trachipleistophora hominis TaxID=72359 RepID=L7JT33_TRAHO|nr:TATA box binding protein (TBP)-associated factor, RNA polymerase II [Trachipleistophora hominis]
MNHDVMNSLSLEQKKIIEINYKRAMNNEISPNDFFEECKRILGPVKFSHLFPTHVPQYMLYTPFPHEIRHYQHAEKERESEPEEQQQKEIKTERLQDIIEYAGVNLKEEQENIGRENMIDQELEINEEDRRNSLDYLFDVEVFVQYVNFIARKRGMEVDDSAYHAMFLALKRKLTDMIEKMVKACEFRVDYIKSEVVTKIENDIRRQLWVLEEQERKEMDKTLCKKGGDDDDSQKKKLKKNVQEREDLIIKKRLSNSVALAALGIQRKSWMTMDEAVGKPEKKSQFQSLYSPYNEKEMEKKIINRKVILDDFIYVLERDKRYNKSVFTIKEYFKK